MSDDTVIDLEEVRSERTPHYAGHTGCRKCGFIWTAVCPVTSNPFFLECPNCERMEGCMLADGLDPKDVQRHYEQWLRARMEADY